MTDLFEDVSVDEFALPTDDARLGRVEAAEPAVEEVAPFSEETGEAVADERLRNPDGTFAKKPVDEVADEAPVAANEQQPGETDSEYATRIAELEAAIAERDARIAEQANMIGRQSAEVGEVRKLLEQVAQRQTEAPPAAPVQITADLIEQNPAYAAQLAYDQDNGPAFAAAFESWKEYDPFTAAAWAAQKQQEQQIEQLRQEQDERLARIEQQVAPVAQTAQAAQLNALLTQAEQATPGLTEFVASERVAALANEFPEVAATLVSGAPEQKVRVLQMLHQIDRGRASDTLKATTVQVARETATAAQQAREEAFVASATTAASGVQPSKADLIADEWDAMDKPYLDGWNV